MIWGAIFVPTTFNPAAIIASYCCKELGSATDHKKGENSVGKNIVNLAIYHLHVSAVGSSATRSDIIIIMFAIDYLNYTMDYLYMNGIINAKSYQENWEKIMIQMEG